MSLMVYTSENSRREGGAGGMRLSALRALIFLALTYACAGARPLAAQPILQNFVSTNVGISSITASWAANGVPAPLGYRLEVGAADCLFNSIIFWSSTTFLTANLPASTSRS